MSKHLSSGFIVLSPDHNVLKVDKSIPETYLDFYNLKEGDNFYDHLNNLHEEKINPLVKAIDMAEKNNASESLNLTFISESKDNRASVEIVPIYNHDENKCTLIKICSENSGFESLEGDVEIERLCMLGRHLGGMAHNLRSPIMAISGAIEGLKELTGEYFSSIGDTNVTDEDHREIAKEMQTWISKIEPYMSYVSEIISTVKSHSVIEGNMDTWFTIEEFAKKVEILMKHAITYNHCKLNTVFKADTKVKLKLRMNLLIQVVNNLIENAIDAYDGNDGKIDFIFSDDENTLTMTIKDYGKGIPDDLSKRLFKETITTKGSKGTGIGLYNSYTIVKDQFGGDLWFESLPSKGTTFYVRVSKPAVD
ncbi:MAG TPA: HAMP domain-containing sensor histidine kinase [Clostridia bacterium]